MAKDHSLAVCHAFKIDRNAIRVTGVKSVQKNIKPIFKRSSSDWNKQTIFVGLIWLTLRVLDFFVNILTAMRCDRAKITLAGQHDRLQSDFKCHSINWNEKKQNNNSSVKFAD